MNCPHCTNAVLLMSERQGVEIDYCPQCRGVWLDRGELDKLMSLASAADNDRPRQPNQSPQSPQSHQAHPDFQDSRSRSASNQDSNGYGRRKKSWMSEIFD